MTITLTAVEIIGAIDAYAVECESPQGASLATIVKKNKAISQLYEIYRLARESHPELFQTGLEG